VLLRVIAGSEYALKPRESQDFQMRLATSDDIRQTNRCDRG